MSDYTVIASNLNMRDQPVNGAVIAVLHHGQIVSGEPSSIDPAWLNVVAAPPSANGDVKGFVSAAYVEENGATAPGAATPVTAALLKLLAPSGKQAILDAVAAGLSAVKEEFGIIQSTMTMCHFLAQAAHESDGFKTTIEYASGRAYEGRRDLGNTQPGDGMRFKGRGLFQLTGRKNYETVGQSLGLKLLENPELAADPAVSLRIAGRYWKSRGIEALAAADNIEAVTRKINGGHNGLEQRKAYYRRARKLFG